MSPLLGLESKKQQILSRISVLDVAAEHVTLRKAGRRWVGLCPFHVEKTPSFTVNPDLNIFKCFGCGKGGDVFAFVMAKENLPFMEAMRTLAERVGVDLADRPASGPAGTGRIEIARVNAWAESVFASSLAGSEGAAARGYLLSRGMDERTTRAFRLGFALDDLAGFLKAARQSGHSENLLIAADLVRRSERGQLYLTFRNRLMFPIREASGRVIGFGGRTLVDDRAKYLNTRQTPLFDKGRGLYGIDVARPAIEQSKRAVVVEGYTDCLMAHQCGFEETVATLGTALTEAHVELLRRYTETVILLFDSDQAGEAAADRAIRVALPRCLDVRLARIPHGKDPAEFLQNEGKTPFSDVLNSSVPALEFLWIQTQSRFHADGSDAARRAAIDELLGVVAEACAGGAVDAVQRGLIINQISYLLRIERGAVDRLLGSLEKRAADRRRVENAPVAEPVTGPANEEQTGWQQMLEVVLAEPGLAGQWPAQISPGRIADPRLRRLAESVRQLAEQLGEFRLMDVLAACTDPEDAVLAAELAQRGESKGNFSSRMEIAVRKVERGASLDALDESKQVLLDRSAGDDVQRSRLVSLDKALRSQRHFVARRLTQR